MENSLIDKTCYNTIDNWRFVADYIQLTTDELYVNQTRKDNAGIKKRTLTDDQISKLLKTASLFSLSSEVRFQKIAFKIAVFLLSQYSDEYDSIPFAVQIILTRLGDLPAIISMLDEVDEQERKRYKDYFALLGKSGASKNLLESYIKFPEILAKKATNIAPIRGTSKSLKLTDFQSRIFLMLRAAKNISFSAPTSAGKSYMVHHYIAEKIKENEKYCAVYIVPTRALIAEVQQSIRQTTIEIGVNPKTFSVFVSANKLNTKEILATSRKVFVLTQERLQEAMSNDPLKNVDLLVVDEAQNVGHKSRGIVLQDAVDDLITANNNLQKLFIAPYIDNPADLKRIFGIKEEVIPNQTSKSPVGQNILLVNFNNTSVSFSVLTYEIEKKGTAQVIPLEEFPTSNAVSDPYTKKAWVATKLVQKDEPTIIYCDTPEECRNVSAKIVENSENRDLTPALIKAIDFFSQQVHEDFYLCDALRNRVGYHYGRMPHFIKLYVKQLFEEKEIDLLCCTSTLLEGVNLPAKNMVLYNPKAGGKMSRLSLLNLAGRAGRLMKDHYGKIFCINLRDWAIDEPHALFKDKAEHVESSVDKTLNDKMTPLINYLENPTFVCAKSVKSLATSLIMKFLKNPDGSEVKNFLKRTENIRQTDVLIILKKLERIRSNLHLDDPKVILKNRSFDPRFQDDLYVDLSENGYVTLPFPKPDNYFYLKGQVQMIFSRISKHLLRRDSKAWLYYGALAANWIIEKPYKEILKGKIDHNKPKHESRKEFHNHMIESLDNDIEKELRYEYTRGLKCYSDIVRHIMDQGKGPKKPSCEELPVYLEWGTYHKNALLLMEVGLSRNSAILINEYMSAELNDSLQCISWLNENQSIVKDVLPGLFWDEVERLLEKSKLEMH